MTETDDPPRRADGGARWRTALFAVGVALLPSALTLGIWLGTGASDDPEPTLLLEPDERMIAVQQAIDERVTPRVADVIMQIYMESQLDPDQCKEDFVATADEPSSARLPFYFC